MHRSPGRLDPLQVYGSLGGVSIEAAMSLLGQSRRFWPRWQRRACPKFPESRLELAAEAGAFGNLLRVFLICGEVAFWFAKAT